MVFRQGRQIVQSSFNLDGFLPRFTPTAPCHFDVGSRIRILCEQRIYGNPAKRFPLIALGRHAPALYEGVTEVCPRRPARNTEAPSEPSSSLPIRIAP